MLNIVYKLLKILNLLIPFLCPRIKQVPCDVLVLSSHDTHIDKTNHILEKFRKKGYNINFVIQTNRARFSALMKVKCDWTIPHQLLMDFAYAKFLVNKFRPKILCSFIHFGVLPSLIRNEMDEYGKTIFFPHAIQDSSFLYSNIDYDYYFIFGESAHKNLLVSKRRIGNTKLVKVGSPYINFISKKTSYKNNCYILFSNWKIQNDEDMQKDVNIIHDWFKENPESELYIKIHPIEDSNYIQGVFEDVPNAQLLERKISFNEAFRDVQFAISTGSVATVEAAIFEIPTIVVNHNEKDINSSNIRISDKYLYLEDFFVERAKNMNELNQRIEEMKGDYDYYVARCEDFVKFHIEYTQDAHKVIIERLSSIYKGLEDFNVIELKESF